MPNIDNACIIDSDQVQLYAITFHGKPLKKEPLIISNTVQNMEKYIILKILDDQNIELNNCITP